MRIRGSGLLAPVVLSLLLGGCSVFMAADKKGVTADAVIACQTKACFSGLKHTHMLDHAALANGGEAITYQSRIPTGSTTRAALHGLLDVVTIGLWEIAGTPIEVYAHGKEFLVYEVTFDEHGTVQGVTIKDAPVENVAMIQN